LEVEESYVGINDIQFFKPEFSTGGYQRAINNLILETKAYGKISDLTLDNFRAHLNEDIIVKIQGDVKGLPDIENISGDLRIDSIYLSGNTSRYYFPDSIIPPQIYIPENFLLEAVAKGNTRLSNSVLEISSAAGGLQANLQLNMDKEKKREYFQAEVRSQGLDLGTIMQKPDTLGKVFMNASMKGSTSDFKQAKADLRIKIDTFHLIGYPYSNFSLNGNIQQNSFEGTAGMDDENIRFSFNGMIDAADSIPDMNFNFNLIGANLMALNITEEDIRVGANIASSISGSNPDNLNGNLNLNNLIIVRNDQVYELDSLFLNAKNTEKSTELSLSSEIIQASYKGSVKPSGISSKLWSHINLFFAFQEELPDNTKIPGIFSFEAHINDHPIISEVFLPELTNFQGIDLQIDYDEGNNELNTKGVISPIQYKNIDIDTVNININSKDTLLLVKINSKGFSQDFINIPGIITEARLANDIAKWTFNVKDEEEKNKYRINGTLKKEGQFISGKLDSSKLVLNYDSWNLPPNHEFRISNDTVIFDNLSLQKEKQVLRLTKTASEPGIQGTKIEFTAFDLETFTNILTTEKIIEAELNGEIILDLGNERFISELEITDLTSYGQKIFNRVALMAEQSEKDRITFSGQFEEKEEIIGVKGFYSLQPEKRIELDANINKLDIQNFQPLLSDMFKTLTGNFNGDLNLSGPLNKMQINGDIQLTDGKIAPRMLGTAYKAKNIQLSFDDNNLRFTDFKFMDAEGDEASVTGSIEGLLSEFPVLDLKVNAKNFTGVNVKEGVNDLFYGKLNVDISANIQGDLSEPAIRGATTITNNTDFNFIVPAPDKASIEQEGLVIFIQPERDTSSILYSGLEQDEIQLSTERNPDINVTLEVKKEASLNIITDPASGENLKIFGEANLNFNMGSGGQISLTGQYIINDGTYNLTLYNVIKRQFKIQEGSSITWSGDPLGAKTDITAFYRLRTSPEGLIANELSNINEEQRRELSQSIPFLVYLNIKGELLNPSTLDFDIKTPPGVTIAEVSNKLNQLNQNESEVNKQAVALLTFGNFIQTQMSTSHPVSYEINAAARNSISRILSTQLNKLADQYIEGVEINVDVSSYTDYTGQQTQATTNVALDVRKEFLNERLTVQVGGKVNIEGDERMANNMNRLAGDVKVLYDLTEDGRFKLKGFNTTEYENIFEGEVTKTGVGFIYNRDIYSLSELFNQKKKENDNNDNNE
ncbi:MAG: translocation/assembly module TamB domain-containing protein, partial [Bacteroidota bacterium]